MSSQIFFRLFLYFGFLTFAAGSLEIYCEPSWITDGNGNFPRGAIDCSGSVGENIIRVYKSGSWYAGRLLSNKGIALAVIDEEVHSFSEYQVLVVPSYCIMNWMKVEYEPPENTIPVDPSSPSPEALSIGRGTSGSRSYCGTYSTENYGLSMAIDAMDTPDLDWSPVFKRFGVEVLTSRYQPLKAEIGDIIFDVKSIYPSDTTRHLIGQSKCQFEDIEVMLKKTIRHEKIINEVFIIDESSDWNGISEVSIDITSPFGSRDIIKKIHKFDGSGSKPRIDNKRLVDEQILIEINTYNNVERDLQICSIAYMIENTPIYFTGSILYTVENLDGGQVRDLLLNLGRQDGEIDGNGVRAEISGTLSGRFLMHTASFAERYDDFDFCTRHL